MITYILGALFYMIFDTLFFYFQSRRLSKKCNYDCSKCKCWSCNKYQCMKYSKGKMKDDN